MHAAGAVGQSRPLLGGFIALAIAAAIACTPTAALSEAGNTTPPATTHARSSAGSPSASTQPTATSSSTLAQRTVAPTSPARSTTPKTSPLARTPLATPIPTPPPTARATIVPPSPTPAPVNLCGAPANPWNYNFCGGTTIADPPATFCNYFNCIANFWNGVGYVIQCQDRTFSKSGGRSGSCSQHGGNLRPLHHP